MKTSDPPPTTALIQQTFLLVSALLEHSPMAVEICDGNNFVLFASPSYRRWFARKPVPGERSVLDELRRVEPEDRRLKEKENVDFFTWPSRNAAVWDPLYIEEKGYFRDGKSDGKVRFFQIREVSVDPASTPDDSSSENVNRYVVRWYLEMTREWTREWQLRESMDIGTALLDAIYKADESTKVGGLFYYPEASQYLSGDFFFARRFEDQKKIVLVVGDCSGHGVPGAILSSLVGVLLDQYSEEHLAEDPAKHLLEHLNKRLYEILLGNETGVDESRGESVDALNGHRGFDGAAIVIDFTKPETALASVSCANFKVWLCRDNNVEAIGDMDATQKPKSVGARRKPDFLTYMREIPYSTRLFAATDGALNKEPFRQFFEQEIVQNDDVESTINSCKSFWKATDAPRRSDDILIVGLDLNQIQSS